MSRDFDREMEQWAPRIAWREPVTIVVTGGGRWLVCRLCLAKHGISADVLPFTNFSFEPDDRVGFDKHIAEQHAQG
jgi:hypothetical protein